MDQAMRVKRVVSVEIDCPGLGDRIKQAREQSGRTVTALADEAGISRPYWHDLEAERMKGAVGEDTIRSLEKVLGVSLGVEF